MPELPDVEVFKQYTDATSLHQKIDDVKIKNKNVLKNTTGRELHDALKGRTFENTDRHGKYLFIQMDNGRYLLIHFGMSGFLKYFKEMAQEPHHGRLLISFSNGFHLAYVSQRMLGLVEIIDHKQSLINEKRIGPDALDFDFPSFRDALSGRRGSIKSTLMNQRIIAGIGNIYADEILFHAKVHPKINAGRLSEKMLKSLFRQMKVVLQTAIDKKADPSEMPHSWLLPHRKEGEKCPQCGGDIEKVKVSGRTAYYCPSCQRNSNSNYDNCVTGTWGQVLKY